jgi:hypothetical protein
MKKDQFKDFIQEHQDEFNMLEPSQDVWKGIENSSKKERRLFDSRVFLRIAASLFFILGAAWIALQIGKMPVRETADKEEVKTEELYDYAFSGISDELAEVEHYYVNEVAQKEALLSNFKVDEDLLEEVQLLNVEFEQLKIEMGQSADPMRVVEAMINNYQLRLEILQSILDQLEREKEKELQNGKEESYV